MRSSVLRKVAPAVFVLSCVSTLACSKAPTTTGVPTESGDASANADRAADESRNKSSASLLLSVDELKQQLASGANDESSPLRMLDVRSRNAYDEGHIPDAVHVNVDDWKKQALAKGGLQDATAWSKSLGDVGITPRSRVVVYSDKPADAARVWWTLEYLGVPNVALLDGGWNHWLKEGGATSKDVPKVKPQNADVIFQSERLAEIDDLKTSYKSKDVAIVDARSQREFDSGRIPGSVRLEWSDLLAADGRFKPRDELRKLFEEQGIVEGKTAITYCQTGGRASLDAFALELAGFQNVKNYYCSWEQWSQDGDAPVEK